MVAAADTTGGTAPNGQRFLATGVANPFANLTNSQISTNLPAAAIKYLGDHQNRGTHSSGTPVADNGSSVTTDDLAINFGKAGTMTPTWNGLTGNMTGALGDALNFYFITRSSSGANTTKPGGDQFDNLVGPAKWTFAQAGNGDYMLTYTAPIPEPETWALMLAGMAIVGSIARRRTAGK
ncbi:MAG: PEPxxWA-CTERM sorting domain-containing protein [Burkholderiales bacterium]|nr:PEPxxWA-CTERM sorting domain-containing protein [Burkholderiales bacterium]